MGALLQQLQGAVDALGGRGSNVSPATLTETCLTKAYLYQRHAITIAQNGGTMAIFFQNVVDSRVQLGTIVYFDGQVVAHY